MTEREFGDDLCAEDPRLKLKWEWNRVASQCSEEEIKQMTHFQTSNAKYKDWELCVVQWTDRSKETEVSYEVQIKYEGNRIASVEGFGTRLEAQIGAEKLLVDWIMQQYKQIMEDL